MRGRQALKLGLVPALLVWAGCAITADLGGTEAGPLPRNDAMTREAAVDESPGEASTDAGAEAATTDAPVEAATDAGTEAEATTIEASAVEGGGDAADAEVATDGPSVEDAE